MSTTRVRDEHDRALSPAKGSVDACLVGTLHQGFLKQAQKCSQVGQTSRCNLGGRSKAPPSCPVPQVVRNFAPAKTSKCLGMPGGYSRRDCRVLGCSLSSSVPVRQGLLRNHSQTTLDTSRILRRQATRSCMNRALENASAFDQRSGRRSRQMKYGSASSFSALKTLPIRRILRYTWCRKLRPIPIPCLQYSPSTLFLEHLVPGPCKNISAPDPHIWLLHAVLPSWNNRLRYWPFHFLRHRILPVLNMKVIFAILASPAPLLVAS